MACTITTGKKRYCKVQPGGLDKVYILDRFNANHITVLGKTNGALTATNGAETASGTAWGGFQFDLDPYASSLTQTIVVNDGGGVGYQQDLSLVFKGCYGKADELMQDLVAGIWQMAVVDNTGHVYFCGLKKGVVATGGSFIHNGDVAVTDNLNYTITFSGTELEPADNCNTEAIFLAQTKVSVSASQTVDGT